MEANTTLINEAPFFSYDRLSNRINAFNFVLCNFKNSMQYYYPPILGLELKPSAITSLD